MTDRTHLSELLYDGDDPYFQGMPAKWASYLQGRPDVPKTLKAVVPRIPQHWIPSMFADLAEAEWTAELQPALARWWRLALQHTPDEELEERRSRALEGVEEPGEGAPLEDTFPAYREARERLEAMSDDEKYACLRQRMADDLARGERRITEGESFLENLRELTEAEEKRLSGLRTHVAHLRSEVDSD